MKKILSLSPYIWMCVIFLLTIIGSQYLWVYWIMLIPVLIFLIQLILVFTPESVKIVVKHRKGKFNSSVLSEIYGYFIFCLFKLYYWTGKNTKISFIFTEKSLYNQNSTNQLDWLKSIGTKSGIKTDTNKEEIAVFRCNNFKEKKFSIAKYVRLKDNTIFKEGSFIILDESFGHLKNKQLELQLESPIELKYLLPVIFWAGGNQKPENDFEYTIKLSI